MRIVRAIAAGMVLAATVGAGAAEAAPELSTTDQLKARRYVSAGDRAYVMGFQDGRFYAQGWHVTGEMGGVWTEPLKLVDGVWFRLDGEWLPTVLLKANEKLKIDKEIYLHADQNLLYRDVVGIMAIMKMAGADTLGMVTDPLE